MSESDLPSLSDLRAELLRVAQTPDLAERTLEVVAIVELVAAPMRIHPVVVGGMAVYFWTASHAFLTYDIDVVMEIPELLGTKLAELGFAKTADGRHWALEGTDVFLEAPSSHLDDDALVIEVALPSGRTAKVLSRGTSCWTGSRSSKPQATRSSAGRSSLSSAACPTTSSPIFQPVHRCVV
jgi:hypothetical protein